MSNIHHDQHDARQDGREANYEGWAQSGPLTTRQGQNPGGGFGLQKSFGRYARAYTVQFALLTPAKGCDTTADISFSVAGQTILRRVSVGNAVSLTGLCQAINIQLYDTTTLLVLEPVSNAVSGTGGQIQLTVTAHGFANGATVFVQQVGGTVEANGQWIVTVIDANNILLRGSTFVNAYTSGGFASDVTPQQYAAIVTVTPGTRGSNALPPTLKAVATQTTGTLTNGGVGAQTIPASGGVVSWAVPQGVGVVSVEVSAAEIPASTENLEVNFFDTTGNILIKAFSIGTGTYPQFVDMPPNCGIVSVVNRDTANVIAAAVTWGIDG
jgi:hypothetical protein